MRPSFFYEVTNRTEEQSNALGARRLSNPSEIASDSLQHTPLFGCDSWGRACVAGVHHARVETSRNIGKARAVRRHMRYLCSALAVVLLAVSPAPAARHANWPGLNIRYACGLGNLQSICAAVGGLGQPEEFPSALHGTLADTGAPLAKKVSASRTDVRITKPPHVAQVEAFKHFR